jgi:hypothetical protein
MITRVLEAIVILAMLSSCASRRWSPDSALADAERDIASGNIRFAYVGGLSQSTPGVPESHDAMLQRYGRLEVGNQGCVQDEHRPERHEYARRYNEKMLNYVAKQRGAE